MSVTVEQISALSELRNLVPEWERLWAKSGQSPFQTPQWLLSWWEHFGAGKLRVLALREGGALTALLPLVQMEEKLRFLGEGLTDWLDGLFGNGAAAELLLGELCSAKDWMTCDFRQLPARSPLLSARLEDGFCQGHEIGDVCPCLELQGEVGRKLLELDYYKRRARRCCQCEFVQATAQNVDELMEALFALHSARWRSCGLDGAFTDARVRAFHRQVAREFLKEGLLRLFALKFGQRIVASYYGFFTKGTAYYYLSGFDPEYKVFSPGAVLVGHAIERSIGEGGRRFDFLRGQEPYKYLWGAGDRVAYRRWIKRS